MPTNFSLGLDNFTDDNSFLEAASLNQKNYDPYGKAVPLQTSLSQDPAPNKTLTTWQVSDVMQGAATLKPTGYATQFYNEQISTDLNKLIGTGYMGLKADFTGVKGQLTPYDVLKTKGSSTGDLGLGNSGNTPSVTPSSAAGATSGPVDLSSLPWDDADSIMGHTHAAREFIKQHWPEIKVIGGYRPPDGYNEHSSGQALDVMDPGDGGQEILNSIALWFGQNPEVFNLKNFIWWQRSFSAGGVVHMENRGSDTQNHKDHIHLHFQPNNPGQPGPMGNGWACVTEELISGDGGNGLGFGHM